MSNVRDEVLSILGEVLGESAAESEPAPAAPAPNAIAEALRRAGVRRDGHGDEPRLTVAEYERIASRIRAQSPLSPDAPPPTHGSPGRVDHAPILDRGRVRNAAVDPFTASPEELEAIKAAYADEPSPFAAALRDMLDHAGKREGRPPVPAALRRRGHGRSE